MDIHFHLGAHRTGTTSFQFFLRANRHRLASRGVEVWTPQDTRRGLFHDMLGNPLVKTNERRRAGQQAADRLAERIARLEQSGTKTLIISEENCLGSLRRNYVTKRLYPNATAHLRVFARAFKGHNTRVLMTMRSYDTYWTSAMGYLVRWGMPVPDDPQINALMRLPRTWRKVGADIKRAFPDASFAARPFEMTVGRSHVQLDALFGYPAPAGLERRMLWHHRSPSLSEMRGLLESRGDKDSLQLLPKTSDKWAMFSPEQSQTLKAVYAQDVSWAKHLATEHRFKTDGTEASFGPTDWMHEKGHRHERRQASLG